MGQSCGQQTAGLLLTGDNGVWRKIEDQLETLELWWVQNVDDQVNAELSSRNDASSQAAKVHYDFVLKFMKANAESLAAKVPAIDEAENST